jgi:hypothetical protein
MMQKAGYLQRTGNRAFDSDGNLHEVAELHILGNRFAIRLNDMARSVSGHVYVQVEELSHNWGYYLGITRGLAQVSVSGKALNIELFEAGSFTVSLNALRSVIYGKERTATIVRIPAPASFRLRRVEEGQQKISATA